MIKKFSDFSHINENSNVIENRHGITTIDKPIIPDAIEIISKNKNAVKFTNRNEFDRFASEQKYFSAGYSHCFYDLEEYQTWMTDHTKSDTSENSVLLKQFGEILQVWDDKNKIGYIIPADKVRK
jgi:hypothetical protein